MKPVNRKLTDDQIKVIIEAERTSALGTAQSSDLSEQRIRALDYYMGDMDDDMPAPEGESSAVSTDVQDTVEGLLPIILDVFVGSDRVVEFKPVGPNDEAAAEQETDFVNHVFYQENDGFLTLYQSVKDALLSKNCWVKWWVEEEEDRTRERYEGLSSDSYSILTADDDIKIVDSEQYETTDPQTQRPTTLYNCVVEKVRKKKARKIQAVPPEEILISKNARTVQSSTYLAHISRKPQADVIAQFPEKAEVIKAAQSAIVSADNTEAFNRQTVEDRQDPTQASESVNKDMRLVEIGEHYIRLPLEEDGIARRYKVTAIGSPSTILDVEEVSMWPLASGTPIIMPHRLIGRSVADLVVDIQQIKTSLLRATLNNAYYANNQRLEVSETHASDNTLDDLLNNRVGGIVRTKMPGGLTPIPTQSLAQLAMPAIEYMDSVMATRTGVSKSNQSLDPDDFSHARPGAVNRLMDAAEMRVKLIARVFAETLIVDIFRGLHQLCQEYSEEKEVVKLRGTWTEVDPREWKNRRHMDVSLPLGGVSKQQMLQFFSQMLGVQQEAAKAQGGMNGPLVSWQNIHATVAQMTKFGGLKSADPYFMQPPPPNPNAPPPPDPRMVEAQAKAQATQQSTQAKIQGDQAEAQADAQLDQQRFQAEQALEAMKLKAQQAREQAEFQHKSALERMRFEHDMQMEQMKLGFQARIDGEKAKRDADRKDRQAAATAE